MDTERADKCNDARPETKKCAVLSMASPFAKPVLCAVGSAHGAKRRPFAWLEPSCHTFLHTDPSPVHSWQKQKVKRLKFLTCQIEFHTLA